MTKYCQHHTWNLKYPFFICHKFYFRICISMSIIKISYWQFIYPPPNQGLTPPGTYKRNVRGSDACRGSNSFWTRPLDRYTRAGLPKCVGNTMSGPPPKTTQGRTQTKDTHRIPGQKLKFLTPPGIEPGLPGWKAGTLPTTPLRRISTRVIKIYYR